MSGPFGGPPPGPPRFGGPAYGQTAPSTARVGAGKIIVLFVGVLVVLALIAGVFIFLSTPAQPVAPCQPSQPCAPRPTLPVVGASPQPGATIRPATPPPASVAPPTGEPTSDAPPAVSGTVYKDTSLNYSFEYDPDVFTLGDRTAGSAVLTGTFFDTQIWIDAAAADTSPSQMITNELGEVDRFLVGRVADQDAYDAVLGPSVGYIPGQGGVWSGTLVSRDGTPLAPGGVTIVSSTDGRITVAVVVIVATPDAQQGGDTQQHDVRSAADDILKSFNWRPQ